MAERKRRANEAEAGPLKKCRVSKATFKKWKHKHEREYQTLSWLRSELERDKRHEALVGCAVCRWYEDRLQSFKNFTRIWITGSINQKVSNVTDHAKIETHKEAMSKMRANSARASGKFVVLTSVTGCSLSTMDDKMRVRITRKFELCFVMQGKVSLLQNTQH